MHREKLQTVAYAAAFARVLSVERINDLGPGTANSPMKGDLEALTVESAFTPDPVCDLPMARACLAGVWLYHDFLEESHRISQKLATPTGSYWHAIMHRREPDSWNSKYWFNRVGAHPVFPRLREAAARLPGARAESPELRPLFGPASWDPFAFIDLCERARSGEGPASEFCRQVQALEWRLLFDFCYRRAIGQAC